MNRHSIFFKLNLVFLFTLGVLIAFFILVKKEIKHRDEMILANKTIQSENDIRKIIIQNPKNLGRRLEIHGYKTIKNPKLIMATLKPLFLSPPPSFPTTLKERIRDGRLKIYRDRNHIYFQLIGPKQSRLVSMRISIYDDKWILYIFAGILGLIALLYWTIMQSFMPLKRLASQIKRFGEGKEDIDTRSSKHDEIAYVANEFDAAVKKIHAMKEARTLFMRNIMHELKTPITKGRLSTAMLEESDEQEILNRAFERMTQLIGEMAEVEKITSQTFILQKRECELHKLIEQSAALLFIETTHINIICAPCTVMADCDMLVIVLKNLIDNAIKYGTSDTVEVIYKKGILEIINEGEPISQSFEQLLEPFEKETSKNSSQSFGLGLYIVKAILNAHGATLAHRYENGRHIFAIHGLKAA